MDASPSTRALEHITTEVDAGDEVCKEEEKEEEEELEDTIPFLANAKPVEPDDHEFPVVHVLHAGELTV